MFTHSYFAAGYFAPNYFPPVVAAEAVEEDGGLDPNRLFAGGAIIHSVRDPRVPFVKALKGYFSEVREWIEGERDDYEELEEKIENLTEDQELEQLESLRDAVRDLANLLIKKKDRPQAIAIPPMPAVLTGRISDIIENIPIVVEDDDDEIMLLMLIQ